LQFYTNNPEDEHYLSENVIHTLSDAMITFFDMYQQPRTWRNPQERLEMANIRILDIVEHLETLLSVRSEWLNIVNDVWNQHHQVWEKKKYIENEAWAAKWQELYLTNNG
jgi:ribosomal protein L11 methylase PrmA